MVLSSNNMMNIRKQKFIDTPKHNSEAATITKHVKDSDASSSNPHIEDTQGTSFNMSGSDDKQLSQLCRSAEQHDDVSREVEPRSYRDVVVNR